MRRSLERTFGFENGSGNDPTVPFYELPNANLTASSSLDIGDPQW